MELFQNTSFWVAVAFVTLFLLAGKKIWLALVNGLDARSAKIATELEEARRIRMEAEAILKDYKEKQAHYEREAQSMLDNARKDADKFAKQAELDAQKAMDERTRAAMQRITVEEQNAMAEIREHVVDIVMAAARDVISAQMQNLSQEEQAKLILADIDRKVH